MRHQAGTTLISLLIGLLISMLCMIGLLTTYRTVVKTGVSSRIGATHDTELQNSLNVSQTMIQNAGFGLEGDNHLLVANITVDTKTTSALLWRYKANGSLICQGLADIADTSNKRKLIVLNDDTDCDSTSNLDALSWTNERTLAHLTDYSSDNSNPQQVTFAKTLSNCTPFGSAMSENVTSHPVVTISAKTSTQNIAGLAAIQVPVCILNLTS